MQNLRIGNLIRGAQERDAIHVAVAPVEAAEQLSPGWHVGVSEGKADRLRKTIGIVDPFLREPVPAGRRFWLFLYPDTITSLRHDWSHPEFGPSSKAEDADPIAISVLRSFAEEIGEEYETTLDYLAQMADQGYVDGRSIYDAIHEEVWDAYERLTGTKVEEKHGSFSCSC